MLCFFPGFSVLSQLQDVLSMYLLAVKGFGSWLDSCPLPSDLASCRGCSAEGSSLPLGHVEVQLCAKGGLGRKYKVSRRMEIQRGGGEALGKPRKEELQLICCPVSCLQYCLL